jgi:hypothetical protein
MKTIFLVATLLSFSFLQAQTMGIGTTSPHSSSILDLNSTSQGLLLPRLNTAQVLSINNPAEGLFVYNTTTKKPVFFDGTAWKYYNDSLLKVSAGQSFNGAIVFFVDNTGQHGLMVAPANLDVTGSWGWDDQVITLIGASSVTDGVANTNLIISTNGNSVNYAAKLCRDYNGAGFNDWYLPANDELYKLFLNKASIGGLIPNEYWSSTEYAQYTSTAFALNSSTGELNFYTKGNNLAVRPIRRF